MKVHTFPTRVSATISGVCLGFGMPALESWHAAIGVTGSAAQAQFAVAVVLLFFVPVLLFVAGTKFFAFDIKDMLRRPFWLAFKELTVRCICWLCGAGLAFTILAAAQAFGA